MSNGLTVRTFKSAAGIPAAPVVKQKTSTSVTLVAYDGYEYRIDGGEWQTSNVFEGLTPNTEYVFYQRVAETETGYASEVSAGLSVKTEKLEETGNEADFNYTVNIGKPVNGKVPVSIDVKANKGLSAVSMSVQVADGATIVKKATDRDYYSNDCTLAFQLYAVSLNGQAITFTLASTDDPSKLIGGSAKVFDSEMKGLISFDIEYDGVVDANTVVVTYVKCTSGVSAGTSSVKYNFPEDTKFVPDTPAVPVAETVTDTRVVLVGTYGYEYKCCDGAWQTSNVFDGLSPNTEYVFYQRVAETNTNYASEMSNGLTVRTFKSAAGIPVAPVIKKKTDKTITLVAIDGYEYRLGNGTWQKNNVFTGLSPNSEYVFYQRIAETNTHYASEASESVTIRTLSSLENIFTFSCSDGKITITGLNDTVTVPESIIIPATIDDYPVTAIGSRAFFRCTGLTSVILPESLTSIDGYAFYGCTGLTSITIPEGVTSIGWHAFSGCTGLTSITIPTSVTSIGEGAFSGCSGLTSITIPASVTSIGRYAFSGCTGLTSITIPASVSSIGNYAFEYCSGLTSITVDENNPVYYSLNNCIIELATKTLIRGCKASVIPSDGSVTSIGDSAFSGCTGLTSINIPASVTKISGSSFSGCSDLINIVVDKNNPVYYSLNNCIIELATKTLIRGCKASVIPSDGSVTSIGDSAFDGCSGLTSITIPENVTLIGSAAFLYCADLTEIDLPDSVETIARGAFSGCVSLTNIKLPDRLISIEILAFKDCTSLINLSIPKNVISIGNRAFCGCTGLTSVIIPDSVVDISEEAFCGCISLDSVYIPASVTSIGWGVFNGCENLTLYVDAGSYAQKYAKENNIPFCEYVSDEDFKFSGASITLYDNLQVNFKVEKALLDKGFTDVYTTFTIDGKTTVVRDYTEDGDYYVFSCSNIRPDQINDKIVATLNGKCLGHTFSAQAEYSISDYCYRMLARCTGAEYAKLRTLLVDLLNYGAASQLYTGHNTDSLANATLTGEQKAEATAQVELSTVQNLKAKEIDSPSVSWKGAGLNLKEAIVLRFKIAAESIDGLSVKVESGDGTWTIPSSMFEQTDGGYYVYFNKLNAAQLSDTVYLTVFNGATAVSNTISYSVESYAYAKQNTTDEVFKNLLDTMMKYGKSAYEYTH